MESSNNKNKNKINDTKSLDSIIDEYMNCITSNCIKTIPIINKYFKHK